MPRWRALRTMHFLPGIGRRPGGGARRHDVVSAGDEGEQVDLADLSEEDRAAHDRARAKIDRQIRVVVVDFDGRPRPLRVGEDVALVLDTEGGAAGPQRAAGGGDGRDRDPRRGRAG